MTLRQWLKGPTVVPLPSCVTLLVAAILHHLHPSWSSRRGSDALSVLDWTSVLRAWWSDTACLLVRNIVQLSPCSSSTGPLTTLESKKYTEGDFACPYSGNFLLAMFSMTRPWLSEENQHSSTSNQNEEWTTCQFYFLHECCTAKTCVVDTWRTITSTCICFVWQWNIIVMECQDVCRQCNTDVVLDQERRRTTWGRSEWFSWTRERIISNVLSTAA